MDPTFVEPALVRLSETALLFVLLGTTLTVSAVVDGLSGSELIGGAGSMGLLAIGLMLLSVGLVALWRSRRAIFLPVSAPRRA